MADKEEYKSSLKRKTVRRENWICVSKPISKPMIVMVHKSKVDKYNLEVIILNAKLSTDSPMTRLAQTSSNSVIKLADKVAIFEIKKPNYNNKGKRQQNKPNPIQRKKQQSGGASLFP